MLKVLLLLIALVGCTPSSLYVQPDGRLYRCAAWGWGWAGAPMAMAIHDSCAKDAKLAGMVPLTDAAIGAQLDTNLFVKSVVDPAKTAGIVAGDQLRSVDGTAVTVTFDYFKAMSKKHAGDVVNLEVDRDGKALTFAVKTIDRADME